MIKAIKIEFPQSLFVKDPQDTTLGLNIVQKGIELIHMSSFEEFTFKKLAKEISSTEASIYRYFENKHQFLLYLNVWYWAWMNYRLDIETSMLSSSKEKLFYSIEKLISPLEDNALFPSISMKMLKSVVEEEGVKSIIHKSTDQFNANGAFDYYKDLIQKLSTWLMDCSPEYEYPNMLITTIIEGANLQHYFTVHLPRLTNSIEGRDTTKEFYFSLLNKLIF